MIFPLTAVRRFRKALGEQRQVEAELLAQLPAYLEPAYLRPGPPPLPARVYGQKHFFSILFLAVYQALGIPRERRLLYGAINHCLRGLVTGTDNLLDDEYKEMLPLGFPAAATRFKSVMHILLFDRLLFQVVEQGAARGMLDRQAIVGLQQALFAALVPIGAEEAGEEGGVRERLSPEEILSAVHAYKGGKLLCLALVAPRFLEKKERQARLALAEKGIYSLGLALQVLDDLTDLDDDLRDRRHNYLASVIAHQGTPAERRALAEWRAGPAKDAVPVEERFPAAVALVMEQAVGEALAGFALLEQAGFWLNQAGAMAVIRILFRLRGLKRLLAFVPPRRKIRRRLGG